MALFAVGGYMLQTVKAGWGNEVHLAGQGSARTFCGAGCRAGVMTNPLISVEEDQEITCTRCRTQAAKACEEINGKIRAKKGAN